MNKLLLLLTPGIVSLSALTAKAEEPADTAATHELNEVVIEAKMQHTDAKSTSYIPTGKIKDAAQNAIDLLQRMAIPQIAINPVSNSVTTPSGQAVTIFVNYIPASEEDIQGLRTSDVRKVEYLDFPSDPRFRGEPHVVNIIVQEYEWGGYTKISDQQFFLIGFSNQSSVFSKFAYKKMTYDLYVSPKFVNSDHVGNDQSATYRFPTQTIERNQTWIDSKYRYIQTPVTFRASYNAKSMQIINVLGFTFNNYFDNTRSGILNYKPNVGQSYDYSSIAPYIDRTASWNGKYFFSLPSQWSLSLDPSFSYTHNNSTNIYMTSLPGDMVLDNTASEDQYYTRIQVMPSKQFDRHHSVFASGLFFNNTVHVNYLGDSPYRTNFSNKGFAAIVGYKFNHDKVSVDFDCGMAGEYQSTNGVKYNDHYPFAHLSTNYSPNQKNQFSLWAQYASNSPSQTERSPNTIQLNEFIFQTGNPMVKNARHTTLNFNYTFLPSNKLSLTAYSEYFGMYDRAVTVYNLYSTGNALIKTFQNSGNAEYITAGLNLTSFLMSRKLIFQVRPEVNRYQSTGYFDHSNTRFSLNIYGAYYLGNWNFTAYYRNRNNGYNTKTGEKNTNRSYYYLSAGWAKRNWNIDLLVANIGRWSWDSSWDTLDTPLYSSKTTNITGNYHAFIGLSATYTFGYGKKIKRGDEVGAQSGGTSAIMK